MQIDSVIMETVEEPLKLSIGSECVQMALSEGGVHTKRWTGTFGEEGEKMTGCLPVMSLRLMVMIAHRQQLTFVPICLEQRGESRLSLFHAISRREVDL